MARSRRTVIDDDDSWTIREILKVKPDEPPPLPQRDRESPDDVPVFFGANEGDTALVFWGTGLISFGPVTSAQKSFMANLATNSDITQFPGDYVAVGFSVSTYFKIEYGVKPGFIYIEWRDGDGGAGRFTITPDAISFRGQVDGAHQTGYSLGGEVFTASSPTNNILFLSDLDVIEGTPGDDSLVGGNKPESLLGLAGADTLLGGGYGDRLEGGRGDDLLLGGAGDDRLFGGKGVDTLLGRAGADALYGGGGRDWADYSEGTGVGVDFAAPESNAGVALGDGYSSIENLRGSPEDDTLSADQAANRIEGLAGDDAIAGRGGADSLAGGAGRDTLVGGGGADWFEFASADSDRVADFLVDRDMIALDGAVFGLPEGALDSTRFVVGGQAQDANDRLIYKAAQGKLYFDPDGTGAQAQVLIATLTGAPAIGANDFIVI